MSIFKLLFGVVASGNPYEWAALALGVVLALGGSFAGGVVWEAHHTIKTELAAVPVAQKAQEKHDQGVHVQAEAKSTEIKTADDKRAAGLEKIIAALMAQPKPQNSCDVPPAVLNLLNEAGH